MSEQQSKELTTAAALVHFRAELVEGGFTFDEAHALANTALASILGRSHFVVRHPEASA